MAAVATAHSIVLPDLDLAAQEAAQPFGNEFPDLESLTTGEWWKRGAVAQDTKVKREGASPAPSMDVPRDQVVVYAVYRHHAGVLKVSAQLYPFKPGESREVYLECLRLGRWENG